MTAIAKINGIPVPATSLSISDGVTTETLGPGDTITFSDSSTVDFTVSPTDTVTAAVIASAVDHDALLNFDPLEHFTQASITTVGTIATGTWQGTAIDQTYLVGQSGTNTGDQTSIVGITGTIAEFNTAITDATLSGSNTGDQTITLTGDITGSGTGSFATTISAGAVDIAMLSATGTADATTFLRGDNTWATPAGSSSPLTTKGDVYTYSTVDARLGVGTNGQVLTADSAEATGLKWATPSGGGGGGLTVTTQTGATYSAANGDFVLINAATHTVTLPAPSADDTIAVKMINATVTDIQVKTQTGDNIDGTDYSTNGLQIYNQYDSYTFISDGTNWFITA
jgi:hypothetical protein